MLEIEPGERLTLDVTLDFHLDVERATVGVVVWDLARELYVYGASSDRIGIPPIHAGRGEFPPTFDSSLTSSKRPYPFQGGAAGRRGESESHLV